MLDTFQERQAAELKELEAQATSSTAEGGEDKETGVEGQLASAKLEDQSTDGDAEQPQQKLSKAAKRRLAKVY